MGIDTNCPRLLTRVVVALASCILQRMAWEVACVGNVLRGSLQGVAEVHMALRSTCACTHRAVAQRGRGVEPSLLLVLVLGKEVTEWGRDLEGMHLKEVNPDFVEAQPVVLRSVEEGDSRWS